MGGAAPRSACPAATFAPAGANASAACAPAVYVDVSVGLPVAAGEFSAARQLAFRQALADAAGATLERVTVVRAVAARRAALATTTVDASIAQPDAAAAAEMAAQLSGAALSAQLVRQGLPAGTLLSVGVREDPRAAPATAPVGLIVAVATAAALAGAAAVWVLTYAGGGWRIPEDERRLRQAIDAMREQVARAEGREGVRDGLWSAPACVCWGSGRE